MRYCSRRSAASCCDCATRSLRARLNSACGLRQFGALLSVMKRYLDAEGDLVIGAVLRRVGALPHGLHIEVRLEVLARRVHLQRLAFDGVLRGREVGVLRLGGGEDFFEGHMERRFFQRDGFDVGRGLRTVDELLEPGLKLAVFEVVHRNIAQELRLLDLRLQDVLLVSHAGAVARVGRLLHLFEKLAVILQDGEGLRQICELVIGGFDCRRARPAKPNPRGCRRCPHRALRSRPSGAACPDRECPARPQDRRRRIRCWYSRRKAADCPR